MRVVLLAVAYLMLCDGVTCRSLAHERSLHRRHELHRKHSHINDVVDTTTTPSMEPSSTNPIDPDSTSSDAYDIMIAQIISQLYSNYTSDMTPLNVTAQPDTLPFENSTLVSELANSTQTSTHTKTASHHHTPHNTATRRPSKHAVEHHSATNTISTLAEQETDWPDRQSAHPHKSHKPPDTKKDDDDDDDDDGDDDDEDDSSDDGSNIAVAHIITPSVTVSARPSVTANLESPTSTQAESEAVRAERANKIIGIVVGLGCVVIGAAGLAGIIIIRKREKARQIVLDDPDVQTRWRPQSFLAVVTTAVTRAQQSCHRENSIKSNGSSESKYGQGQTRPQSPIAV
ncbi:hypothetical protein K450DRAFT_278844 [Umbelopsis ramanniana AG]|uniref:Mid2 domain-containing protein n=1 Tax=Umbelopsis ramanniana AG TaxID=1314678 RepID=A0AAD5EEC7_UMBRA|nr:uncharacterized protein K450DRAFT_278844 [Umbelopsis ramanniana AG]KAI8581772.1 hypothetical protein K450DRAFT_278844 [Umbelopsis ramanniana AG]